MLTCYGHNVRLPQNDLAYVAFRIALQDTLSNIELHLDLEEEPDLPVGYLTEVPFLEQVPLPVQVDLLADAWARHFKPDLIEASLLDAAIVYAACMTAGHIIDDMPEVALVMLRDGPRKVHPRIIRRASDRLEEMFEGFWDDRDFFLIEEFQGLPPDHAKRVKYLLGLTKERSRRREEALRQLGRCTERAVGDERTAREVGIKPSGPMVPHSPASGCCSRSRRGCRPLAISLDTTMTVVSVTTDSPKAKTVFTVLRAPRS